MSMSGIYLCNASVGLHSARASATTIRLYAGAIAQPQPSRATAQEQYVLQEDVATKPSPLASLHVHRRVLGVIGILHCPAVRDLEKAYAQFQQTCRSRAAITFSTSVHAIAQDRLIHIILKTQLMTDY